MGRGFERKERWERWVEMRHKEDRYDLMTTFFLEFVQSVFVLLVFLRMALHRIWKNGLGLSWTACERDMGVSPSPYGRF